MTGEPVPADAAGPRRPDVPAQVGDVFTAAAADFAVWEPLLWQPLGRRAAAVAGIRAGDTVLDACCGSGASAIPAGRAAGPTGRVHAVDLSTGLLARGRDHARAAGLATVEFEAADARELTRADYDVLLCCYGVFFFDDMDGAIRHLLARLRPGGRFAILTWASAAMIDIAPAIIEAIRRHHPDLAPPAGSARAQRIATPPLFERWLGDAGAEHVEVQYIRHEVSLDPDRLWSLVVGTGFRDLLPSDASRWPAIRAEVTAAIDRRGIASVRLDSLLAHGRVGGAPRLSARGEASFHALGDVPIWTQRSGI